MQSKYIKGIIFDAEGVVVNTEELWDKSQELLLDRRGLVYDRDYLKPKMAGQTLLEGVQLMIDHYQLDEVPSKMEQERSDLIHTLFEQEIAFIHGFKPFIKEINRLQMKKSVATAMKKSLMQKVQNKLDLEQYFGQDIYHIEDVNNKSKPQPDVFLFAAEKMGLNPEECIVIEDAPHGIEAANRAGCFSIGIATTFSLPLLKEADYSANSFAEILKFIKLQQSKLKKHNNMISK